MKEQILGILTCLLALFGCKSESCDVRALCVRDEIGNYIIKWETNPVIKGIAKLYVSDVPDKFDMNHPAASTSIEDGFIRYITSDNIQRKYFRITFNDHSPQDVAARYTFMDNDGNRLQAVAFGAADRFTLAPGEFGEAVRANVLVELSLNDWNGEVSVQGKLLRMDRC